MPSSSMTILVEGDRRTGVIVRASVKSVRSLTKNRAICQPDQSWRGDDRQQSNPTRPHLWRFVLNESAYLLISSIHNNFRCSGRAFATPAHWLVRSWSLRWGKECLQLNRYGGNMMGSLWLTYQLHPYIRYGNIPTSPISAIESMAPLDVVPTVATSN